MTDEQFQAFVLSCHAELTEKQPSFVQCLTPSGQWFYDLAALTITFQEATRRAVPIGSYSPHNGSWLWAWANEDFPPLAREASSAIQGLHETTGFQVFRDPGFPVLPEEVNDLIAMSIHQLNAVGFFRSPTDGPTLYLAVF